MLMCSLQRKIQGVADFIRPDAMAMQNRNIG